MGGKVLRRAGAALLATVFMATIPARGQTSAGNQTARPEASALSLQGLVAASRENGVSAANGLDFISFENTASTENSLVSTSFENAASFEKGLTPEGVSYIFDSYAGAGYVSGSRDAELPDAPARAPFSSAAAAPEDQSATYEAMTGRERLGWIVKNTLWPEHLAGGVITSAAGTGLNRPREDGPHWGGFGERFGVRLTGVATSNVMEAGIGALWGEDPRYFSVPEYSFRARVKNVIVMTFLARRPDGNFRPAYARYIAFSGNNFLANAWRPDSEANVHDAVLRTLEGFAGRMASNAWDEFWPQAKGYIFHRGR